MSKLVSDLFDISELAHHGPENLFISLIKIVGAFIFLFFINWRLAVPLLFLVVLMLIFSLRQNRRMQATFMDNRRKIGDINARLQDTLSGIRVVQSFANEEIEWKKISEEQRRISGIQRCELSLYGKFYEQQPVFPGTDVSGDPGLWRMADRTRKNWKQQILPCMLCTSESSSAQSRSWLS